MASRFILLEADADVTPWSRICVSQADVTLLIAAPTSLPEVWLSEVVGSDDKGGLQVGRRYMASQDIDHA